MRICLLTPELLPAWGGVGAYVYHLARELRDKAEVHVLTSSEVQLGENGAALDGVHVHSILPHNGSAKGASTLQFQLGVSRELPKLTRDYGFDIVHANHAYMSDLFARLRRSAAATVLTVHTTLDTQAGGTQRAGPAAPHQPIEDSVLRWRPLLSQVERYYLKRTPSMIFVSRWVRERTLRRYGIAPRISKVIPNGIDTDLFTPTAKESRGEVQPVIPESPTLLFAGRLLAQKGITTLFQAMQRLDPDIRLKMAGPGEQGDWRSLVQRLGLPSKRCQFLGRVPYAQMPSLYRQASAVILPSFAESYPLVALEAMASGTPLVAANAGGISEIVRDEETGWLFPPGDVAQLVSRIENVLTDSDRAQRVCARARAWAEEFATVGRMGDETLEFYKRALDEAS